MKKNKLIPDCHNKIFLSLSHFQNDNALTYSCKSATAASKFLNKRMPCNRSKHKKIFVHYTVTQTVHMLYNQNNGPTSTIL